MAKAKAEDWSGAFPSRLMEGPAPVRKADRSGDGSRRLGGLSCRGLHFLSHVAWMCGPRAAGGRQRDARPTNVVALTSR